MTTPRNPSSLRPDGRLKKPDAKKKLLSLVSNGVNIYEAVESLGYSRQTYEGWRKGDSAWAQEISRARRLNVVGNANTRDRGPMIPFGEFSEKYLKARVFPHSQNVVDLIEGREPGWLHPAMTYQRAEKDLVIVNMPPEHAKTMTFTINYSVYQTVMNPNIRGLVVSKTRDMAMKMLYAIKARLTEPAYADLIEAYAPGGGFDGGSAKWTQDTIYLNPEIRDSGEKDPTWQALGIGGHIYGARADVIILDDVVDLSNAHDHAKQIDWILSEVMSRLSPHGVLIMVGTRLAPQDLYMEIQNERLYPDETSPWTYLAMPAVLEFDDDPEKWVTLWPRSNQSELGMRGMQQADTDGLYPKWNGPRLATKRSRMTPALWARVYQQQQVGMDTVFLPEDVQGCINGARNVGLIPTGKAGVRPQGMSGLTVVAGLDPATSGFTSMVVIGLDLHEKKRYLLDVFNKANCKPDEIRETIYRLTEKYGVTEWVVETNGFQGFLVHDREVNQFLASRGTIMRPHFTGNNKQDPDFGVSAMAGLFKGWREGHNLIELPSTHMSEGVKALVEQLCVWMPQMSKKQKTDAVMALWMAETACIRRIEMASTFIRSHTRNPFLTRYDRSQQSSVNLMDVETYDRLVRA